MGQDDFLSERVRAQDILLGAMGYGEDAQVLRIERTADGFSGRGRFSDGEEFDFKSDFELDDLDRWALGVLLNAL